jgi:hypothetical protein
MFADYLGTYTSSRSSHWDLQVVKWRHLLQVRGINIHGWMQCSFDRRSNQHPIAMKDTSPKPQWIASH